MKLIIFQENIKAKKTFLCLLLLIITTVISSNIINLKSNSIDSSNYSDNSDVTESNRIGDNYNNNYNNQTNKIKKVNFRINFKLANVSMVFPQPIEEFRLSYSELNEENRKSINPLLIPNNNQKANGNRNFLVNSNDNNSYNETSSIITVINEKNENIRCNYLNQIIIY